MAELVTDWMTFLSNLMKRFVIESPAGIKCREICQICRVTCTELILNLKD